MIETNHQDEKYRTFIEENPDGFWERDSAGCVTLVNRAALEIIGYSRDEVIGKPFDSLSVEPQEVTDQRAEKLRCDGVLLDQRVRIRAKNGTIKTLNETARAVRDPSGTITHYQYTFRDVSARVRMEEELARRIEELKAISHVGELLAWAREPTNVLHQVACAIAQVLSADSVAITLREGAILRVVWSSLPEDTVQPILTYHEEILGRTDPLVVSDRDDPAVDGEHRAVLTQLGCVASLGIPLVAQQTPLGILFVNKTRLHHWESEEIRLAGTLSRQLAAALHNANLLRETRARVRELESLEEMSALAASLLGESTVVDIGLDAIRDALGVDLVGIHLLDGNRFKPGRIRGVGQQPIEPLELTPMIRGILRAREPFVIDSRHPQTLDRQALERLEPHHLPAIITMPMLVANGAIGILSIGHSHEHIWTGSEIRSVKTIANELAMAISNGRHYREQVERADKLRLLMELSAACSATLQSDILLRTAAEKVQAMLDASQVSIRLVQGEFLSEGVGLGYADPNSRARPIKIDELLERVLAAQQPLPICDLETFPGLPLEYVDRKRREGAQALLCVPLIAQGQSIGLLSIFFPRRHEWSTAEVQFLQTIASTVAVSLTNARLYESLRQEQRDTEMILNSVFSGVFTTDREGIIQTWNRAADEMTGYKAETMRGQNWTRVVHVGKDQPDLLVLEAMEGGEIVFGWAPRTLQTANGREIPLAEAAAPLRDSEGRIRGAVGAFWDRTKEHQAERAKLEFLAEVSHELRNSLTVVLSMAPLLRAPKAPRDVRMRAIDGVANEVERLKDFSNRFLQFEHAKAQHPLENAPFNLAELLKQSVAEIRLKYPGRRFKQTIKAEWVYGDRVRLQTVLLNLLDNAAKYSPPVQPIGVRIRRIAGERVRVDIHNKGGVIPPEIQTRIFERGFGNLVRSAEDDVVENNGIGLWLVRTKLQEMGGEICFESDEAKGTTFYFTLQEAREKYGQTEIEDPGRR